MEVVNKYQNGKIYKLVHDGKVIYVGSTIQKLNERLNGHKAKSKVKPDMKIFKYICNVGWDNITIELIENVNCNSKNELETREKYYIKLLKPDLNQFIPTRNKKEYYQDNRNDILDNMKNYYHNNKDVRKEYREKNKEAIFIYKHLKTNCECGSVYRKCDKLRHEKSLKHQNYIKPNNNNQVNI